MLRVYICDDHDYLWPVGVASVVVAESEAQAQALLDERLKERGLKPFAERPYTLMQVDVETPQARIILDGNY